MSRKNKVITSIKDSFGGSDEEEDKPSFLDRLLGKKNAAEALTGTKDKGAGHNLFKRRKKKKDQ